MKKEQYLLSGLFIMMLATAVLFMGTSILNAGNIKFKKKSAITSKTPEIAKLPDLVIKNAVWSSNPKEGDIVGASASLNITVWNKGIAPAGDSKLKIDCKSLTGTNYPYPLAGMINVQPLGPGKSMTYAWPSASSEKWFSGKYRLTFTADYHFNLVTESNETNNTGSLTFTVLPKTDFIKKIKAKPVVKPKLIADLEVISVSLSNDNPWAGEDVIVQLKLRTVVQSTPLKYILLLGFGIHIAI